MQFPQPFMLCDTAAGKGGSQLAAAIANLDAARRRQNAAKKAEAAAMAAGAYGGSVRGGGGGRGSIHRVGGSLYGLRCALHSHAGTVKAAIAVYRRDQ